MDDDLGGSPWWRNGKLHWTVLAPRQFSFAHPSLWKIRRCLPACNVWGASLHHQRISVRKRQLKSIKQLAILIVWWFFMCIIIHWDDNPNLLPPLKLETFGGGKKNIIVRTFLLCLGPYVFWCRPIIMVNSNNNSTNHEYATISHDAYNKDRSINKLTIDNNAQICMQI